MALTKFKSRLIADCGISMGDEGKGRLISEVIEELRIDTGESSPVDVVIKINGGANSGHTAGGLKLNLLPAGVVDQSVTFLAIGAGVVADQKVRVYPPSSRIPIACKCNCRQRVAGHAAGLGWRRAVLC